MVLKMFWMVPLSLIILGKPLAVFYDITHYTVSNKGEGTCDKNGEYHISACVKLHFYQVLSNITQKLINYKSLVWTILY